VLSTAAQTLLGIGANDYDKLGVRSGLAGYVPKTIGDLRDVTDADIGETHVLAVNNGRVFGLGDNWNGLLGLPASTKKSVPTLVPGLPGNDVPNNDEPGNFKAVAAGADFSMALTKQGKVYTWGVNEYGQLGRETEDGGPYEPGPVEGPLENLEIVEISAGDSFAIARAKSGEVYSWGKNEEGQLGVPYRYWVPMPRVPGFEFPAAPKPSGPSQQPTLPASPPNQPSGPATPATDAGTQDPSNPGTEDPKNPGSQDPNNPGTEDPNNPGSPTTQPTNPPGQNQPPGGDGTLGVSGSDTRGRGEGDGIGGGQVNPPGTAPGKRAAISRFGTRFKTVVVPVGATAKLRVTTHAAASTRPGKAKVSWRTGNAKIASPAKNTRSGVKSWRVGGASTLTVKAFKPGRTKVTLSSPGARKAVITVKVVPKRAVAPVRRVELTAPRATLTVGKSVNLRPHLTPPGAQRVAGRWTSTDRSVATVDPVGRVTARGKGSAVIVLKVGGKVARFPVRVR
jgi:hypothetical protein